MKKPISKALVAVVAIPLLFWSCKKSMQTMETDEAKDKNASTSNALLATTRYLDARNGPDETGDLQSLINQSQSGDQIIIRAGNHYFTGTAHINKSGLVIAGEHNATDPTNFLRKASAAPGQGVSVIDVDPGIVNTTIDWIYIDGGMLPEPNMRVFGNDTRIYNSHFRNSGNTGLLIHQAHRIWVEGVKSYYNYMCGISQYGSSDNNILNSQVYENGAEGLTIDVYSHNCTVNNLWIYKNNMGHRGVGGIGIDASNGAHIHNCTIDMTYGHAVRFQNNLNQPDDGCQVYDSRITNNQGCAISMRHPQLVTNFGQWGNTMTGNSGGTICTEP